MLIKIMLMSLLLSSYCDYAELRNGTLCDRTLAENLIGFNTKNFINESYSLIDEEISKKIFLKDYI